MNQPGGNQTGSCTTRYEDCNPRERLYDICSQDAIFSQDGEVNMMLEETLSQEISLPFTSTYSEIKTRKILKVFLLERFNHLFHELFQSRIQSDPENFSMECYAMDSKIIQLLIHGILETGEYTLEGIAFYTRIPFDVIYDAACGSSNQFSITPWAKVVDLYLQLKPDVTQALIDKLLIMKEKNHAAISFLLNEP